MKIKQLVLQDEVFAPQTIAEAVLVKDTLPNGETQVTTLDKKLDKKVGYIITPVGSGLTTIRNNETVTIVHSNSITPNDSPSSVKVKYDNRGHIIETAPSGKFIIITGSDKYAEYDGSEDIRLNFGDDFKDEDKKIILKWNNL